MLLYIPYENFYLLLVLFVVLQHFFSICEGDSNTITVALISPAVHFMLVISLW
jgi:hypothetical protein